SPLAPESDEEKEKPVEAKEKAANDKPAADKAKEKEVASRIDVEGIDQRILPRPLPAGNYVGRNAAKNGPRFLPEMPVLPTAMPMPAPGQPFPGMLTVQKFELPTRKTSKVVESVSSFDLSANGEKMLYRQADKWFIAPIPPTLPSGGGAAQLAAAA